MAASLAPTLTNSDFNNWLKGALAILFAKEGLTDFVGTEINRCHNSLLQLVPAANVHQLCSCTIHSLPKCTPKYTSHRHIPTPGKTFPPNTQLCSRGVCHVLMDGICQDHRFRNPSWKNTDPRKWCTDPYEIAKCYMPPDGYADKSSMAQTDFNGTVAIIINNKTFQKKLQANLASISNICTEARQVGREVRHSANHSLSDSDLRKYIDDLINLLCDPLVLINDSKAKDAVNKLKQLKANTLTIHANDITEVLKDSVRETFSEQEQQYLRSIEDHFSKQQTDCVSDIEKLIYRKKTELEEIARNQMKDITRHAETKTREISLELKNFTRRKKKAITKHTKTKMREISLKASKLGDFTSQQNKAITRLAETNKLRLNHGKSDEEKLKDLKEDLIVYYRDTESTISLSPLADEHDEHVINFYVKPPLSAYENPHLLCHSKTTEQDVIGNLDNTDPNHHKQSNNATHKQTISSYRELFFQNQSNPFRKIYVTADAGLGKTSLCKHITMNWCQSHKPEELLSEKYEADDLKAMKEFDLLFLLYLREHVESDLCILDSLVQKKCTYLSRRSQYTRAFLEKALHEKRCLLILDGLDEWAHPHKCENKTSENKTKTPHNIHPGSCIVMTTLRPWKLGTVGLGSKDIDRHVEICALDDRRSSDLTENAIQILNKIYPNAPEKCTSDFDEEVSFVVEISNNPYIKLHLICLWFEGSPIGKTRCEIYSNIIELILRRGMKKKLPSLPELQLPEYVVVPSCMRNNKLSHDYRGFLSKLGKLAFFSLFNENKESSLIFDRNIVNQYIASDEEIDLCLKYGLLCQTKDSKRLSEIRHNMYFQHKSIQEFFAAFYINAEFENESLILPTILQVCRTISETLEMSEFFIFLCGINPNVFSLIFKQIQNIVENDDITRNYRSIACNPELLHDHRDNYNYYDYDYDYYYTDYYDYDYEPWYQRFYDPWNKDPYEITMRDFQSMQVACIKENNENDDYSISLQDLFLEKHFEHYDLPLLLARSNSMTVKSCCIKGTLYDDDDDDDELMKIFFQNITTTVQTLRVRKFCLRDFPSSPLSILLARSALNYLLIYDVKISETDMRLFYENIGNIKSLKFLCVDNISRSLGQSNKSRIDNSICYFINLSQLQTLHLTKTSYLLQHNNIKQLFISLGCCKTLQILTLTDISCSDHSYCCPDVQFHCCEDSQLQKLKLKNLPVRQLDISLASRLQQVNLNKIPLLDLRIATECLQPCIFIGKFSSVSFPHSAIYQLITSIGSGKMFKEVQLKQIKCLEHCYNCPDVQLKMCQNSQLQALTLDHVPVRELDLSNANRLEQLCLFSIPLLDIRIATECLKPCTLNSNFSSVSLSHSFIEKFITSIGSGIFFGTVQLTRIKCSNDRDSCPGVPLSISSQLQKINLANNISDFWKEYHDNVFDLCEPAQLTLRNVPISVLDISNASALQQIYLVNILPELRTDTQCLQPCILIGKFSFLSFSHSAIHKFITSVGCGKMFKEIKLKQIECSKHRYNCPGVLLKICQNSQLQALTLENVPVSVLDISNASALQQIYLVNILPELRTDTQCLQPCILIGKFSFLSFSHSAIHKFITSIGSGKMFKEIKLKQIECSKHRYNCPDVRQKMCQNSQLQALTLDRVPVSELDLSNANRLEQLYLFSIPLLDIRIATECTLECIVTSVSLSHSTIKHIITSIGSVRKLEKVVLEHIMCSKHADKCAGFRLKMCQNSRLKSLTLCKVPISHLDISQASRLQKVHLVNIPLSGFLIARDCQNPCTLKASHPFHYHTALYTSLSLP